ncbi:late embryogenesis abundant protein At1g64065-like [Diospyros lotus]|uniref:late embryogenesis abundant protein At1g64065-like n=1 Tax=Diospyros lotus TaxID=55363 RepID=UPI00225A10CE|nr:late embryogenesis abundant protein At1g64065-like [Diospyros lotus]
MEAKQQQAYHPPMSNGYNRADEEAAAALSDEELRRQKRKKWILYIIAFVIFQTAVIALFSMTVMKFRTPKFRVLPATFGDNFQTSNSSINLTMYATLGVKNTNFGPYKFDNTTIFFYDYQNTTVGSAAVRKSKANFRSTKKLDVAGHLVMPANSDSGSGILPLTAKAEMKGKVTIMFMFKKKKSTKLDCSMEVNTNTKAVQNVKCN